MASNPDSASRMQENRFIGNILDNEEDSSNHYGNFDSLHPSSQLGFSHDRPSSAPPIFLADQNVCLKYLQLFEDSGTLFYL